MGERRGDLCTSGEVGLWRRIILPQQGEGKVYGFKTGRWVDVVMEACGNYFINKKNQSHYLRVRREEKC